MNNAPGSTLTQADDPEMRHAIVSLRAGAAGEAIPVALVHVPGGRVCFVAAAPREGQRTDGAYFALGCHRPSIAPVGSTMIENDPAPITSVTSRMTVAPSDFALAVAAARSSTCT